MKVDLSKSLAQAQKGAEEAGPLLASPASGTAAEEKAPAPAPAKKTAAKKAPARPAETQPTARPGRDEHITRAATIVPVDLYKILTTRHAHEGSFGQLITWACEDYAEDVVAEALRLAAPPRQISRVPRGVGANRGRVETRQIAPRFLPEENALVEELLETIRDRAAQANPPIDQKKVTRSKLNVAALRVWSGTEHTEQGE